jgi:dolichol-phosphate mannosyltransferase
MVCRCAITFGIDHSTGDGVVIMMADESDDCREVVRCWELLNQGWDAVFGSRFMRGGGVIDYPTHKLADQPPGEPVSAAAVPHTSE